MGIKEGEKREGEQDAGLLRAASGALPGLRARPPSHRKIQRWGPNSRFVTRFLVEKGLLPGSRALEGIKHACCAVKWML